MSWSIGLKVFCWYFLNDKRILVIIWIVFTCPLWLLFKRFFALKLFKSAFFCSFFSIIYCLAKFQLFRFKWNWEKKVLKFLKRGVKWVHYKKYISFLITNYYYFSLFLKYLKSCHDVSKKKKNSSNHTIPYFFQTFSHNKCDCLFFQIMNKVLCFYQDLLLIIK